MGGGRKVSKFRKKAKKRKSSGNHGCHREREQGVRQNAVGQGGVRKVEFCEEKSKEKGGEGGQSGSESPVIALTLS